jgi:hypothetical protein
MKIRKWISSDGSELVPTTDVEINLTLPNWGAMKTTVGTQCLVGVRNQRREPKSTLHH